MKKLLLLLMTFVSTGLLAQQTFIPDADFEQALVDLGVDNTLNNFVPTASIDTITVLELSLKGIASLEGIEDFTALSVLNCDRNNLSSLDLSSNTNLTELVCYNNDLTNLNLFNNKLLTSLQCSSNPLNTLEVSQSTALTTLRCNNT